MLQTMVSLAVLCALICTCTGFILKSPCPGIFRYDPEVPSKDGQWHGKIMLPHDVLRSYDQINIVLNKPILELKILAETVWTEDGEDFLISNLTLEENKTNAAYVHFDVVYIKSMTPPKLKTILFNNRSICSLKRETRNTKNEECGKVIKVHGNQNLTDPEVNKIKRDYPWHAAVYKYTDNEFKKYHCGGSLITKQHIITAAHCVLDSNNSTKPANPNTLLVYLGLKNRRNLQSIDVQKQHVTKVTIHPEFKLINYHNDLAILKLGTEVTITVQVRPICLWSGDGGLQIIKNSLGTFASWGVEENDTFRDTLKYVRLPFVPKAQCLPSNPDDFETRYGNKTFCAGYGDKNVRSVSNGDVGGGLAFIREEGTVYTIWQLRGVASVDVIKPETGVMDQNRYILFTDTAKYLNWIRQQLTGVSQEYSRNVEGAPVTQSTV